MSEDRLSFSNRLGRITRRHTAMANGYTASVRDDGLIIVKPRRVQFRFPIRGFFLLIAVFVLFKGFMLHSVGETTYNERLDVLRNGNVFEKIGAVVMSIDPISDAVARGLRPLIS